MGTHSARASPAQKRSASTDLAGTHSATGADPRAGRGPFPEPQPVVLPMVSLGLTKPADSDLMHQQFRLSILQWNPGPARRKPTQIIAATFHAVILQEASDHVPHITDQFIAYTGNTDLAILLNKDNFEPNPAVFAFNEASTSRDKIHGAWCYSSFDPFCTPTVTFCSVNIHNIVTKKRGVHAPAQLRFYWR